MVQVSKKIGWGGGEQLASRGESLRFSCRSLSLSSLSFSPRIWLCRELFPAPALYFCLSSVSLGARKLVPAYFSRYSYAAFLTLHFRLSPILSGRKEDSPSVVSRATYSGLFVMHAYRFDSTRFVGFSFSSII